MATVAETLQAQLADAKTAADAATAKVTELETALAATDPSWLQADVDKLREFLRNAFKHIGL